MLPHSGKDDAQKIIEGILRELNLQLPLTARCESITWIPEVLALNLPIWSRRLSHNMEGVVRSKWYEYDIEIPEHLWSLWGRVYSNQAESQPKDPAQFLACCMVACCAAIVFPSLGEWTPKLLDAIVVNGNNYFQESRLQGLENLSVECDFQDMCFLVQLQLVCVGQLYSVPLSPTMCLYESLSYFFTLCKWGILECQQRYLAFGYTLSREGGYFLYDCSSSGMPIFPDDMGTSYILRVKHLLLLLYCIVVTLDVSSRNVDFKIYSVAAPGRGIGTGVQV